MKTCALFLSLLAPLLSAAASQDPAPKPAPAPAPHEGEKPDEPVMHVPLPGGADDVHEQMKKLIGEVELGLRKIDKLLAQAANQPRGGSPTIPGLVHQSQAEGQAVVQAIDKLLELSQHPHPGSQSGSDCGNGLCQSSGSKPGGSPRDSQSSPRSGDQKGQSPLDSQRDTTTQRENTPDKPGAEQGPQPQGNQPAPSSDPRGNKKSAQDGRNQPGQTAPKNGTEKVEHGPDAREGWGWLPENARDVFRTQGGGAMPARYREWIDAYYRKLNQKP